MPGECRASECSLLSHDLHRLGYGRMVVDPGVQVAYNHWDAAGMHIEAVVRSSTSFFLVRHPGMLRLRVAVL